MKLITASAASLGVVLLLGVAAAGGAIGSASAQAPGRCPRHGLNELRTRNPEATAALVPAGPTAALVCRYRHSNHIIGGKPSFPPRFAERKVVAADRVKELRASFQKLRPFPRGEFDCEEPNTGLNYLVVFDYRNAAPVYVHVSYESCQPAYNDPRHTYFEASAALEAELNALLPPEAKPPR
jgi:hypothetical protein